tara:strand:+ start:139 stop:894 length:756 start_codon:yes stop_codon:yes gene_type:complete
MTSINTDMKLPVAVVTGAGSGIGFAVVEKLLLNDYIVYACTRSNTNSLKKLIESDVSSAATRLFIKQFDINDSSSVKAISQEIFKQFKRVDVLINSAGIPQGKLFLLSKTSDIFETFETNFFSLLSFTQSIARIMGRMKNGSIINISSVTSFRADPGTLAYGSSKAALNYATQVLSKELAPQGIRVNAVAPGITETSMLTKMDSKAIDDQLESSSLKKIAKPSDVAALVFFLCSKESSHITGQIIRVDGGQ